MNEITEIRARGIQQPEVFAAADALLAEGKRPTIERVRLKIGRGSPNTVSPMLERWFATLGARLGQGTGAAAADRNEEEMPVAVRNAAQLLWESARRDAAALEQRALEASKEDLQVRETSLAEAQAALMQRAQAFAEASASLEAALVASQQAAEAQRHQMRDQSLEAQRVHAEQAAQIQRLSAQLSEALARQEATRQAHAEAIEVRDQTLRRSEERHAQQEKRMLLEVDRARHEAKALEGELTQERKRRARGEEAASRHAGALQEELQKLQAASRRAETALRDRVTALEVELAQAQGDAAMARREIELLRGRIDDDKQAHEATRRLLAEALAHRDSGGEKPGTRGRRRAARR